MKTYQWQIWKTYLHMMKFHHFSFLFRRILPVSTDWKCVKIYMSIYIYIFTLLGTITSPLPGNGTFRVDDFPNFPKSVGRVSMQWFLQERPRPGWVQRIGVLFQLHRFPVSCPGYSRTVQEREGCLGLKLQRCRAWRGDIIFSRAYDIWQMMFYIPLRKFARHLKSDYFKRKIEFQLAFFRWYVIFAGVSHFFHFRVVSLSDEDKKNQGSWGSEKMWLKYLRGTSVCWEQLGVT